MGQSFIITTGLVLVMVMSAIGVQAGKLTVGDFVMVNAYMVQITMPLELSGHGLPRNPAGFGGYGGDVPSAWRNLRKCTDKPGARAACR